MTTSVRGREPNPGGQPMKDRTINQAGQTQQAPRRRLARPRTQEHNNTTTDTHTTHPLTMKQRTTKLERGVPLKVR
jgi:hypothetical protein